MSPTTFRWGAATDKGQVREDNEDFMVATSGLFVVADGMGGHRGGETASHLAVQTLQAQFTVATEPGGPGDTGALVRAVELANHEILQQASTDSELEGMGTTLCALATVSSPAGEQLAVVNVGDSRLYLFRGGELRQVTDDHSLVATLERQGRLTAAEAAVHPQRNILTRALGIDDQVMVDSWELHPVAGDRYLLCTDGLFNEVDDARVAATLRRLADPSEAARELVRLANDHGGRDNVSVVVVDVVDVVDVAGAAGGTSTGNESAVEGGAGSAREGSGSAGPTVAEPTPTSIEAGDQLAGESSPRVRRLTWRVVVFLVVLLAIVGAAIGIIVYGTGNSEPPPPTTTTTSSSTTTTSTTVLIPPPAPQPLPVPAP